MFSLCSSIVHVRSSFQSGTAQIRTRDFTTDANRVINKAAFTMPRSQIAPNSCWRRARTFTQQEVEGELGIQACYPTSAISRGSRLYHLLTDATGVCAAQFFVNPPHLFDNRNSFRKKGGLSFAIHHMNTAAHQPLALRQQQRC